MGLVSEGLSLSNIPELDVAELGPLIELSHSGFLSRLEQADKINLNGFHALISAINSGHMWIEPAKGQMGVLPITEFINSKLSWTNFAMSLKRAAIAGGFTGDHAGRLLAAIGEFRDNVIEHSQNIASGSILFAVQTNKFEFIVLDSGVGLVQSLKQNPQFSDLSDAGTALDLALTDGVSSHGENSGKGYGFRPLFLGLANISKSVRFCSGDHCKELTRDNGGSIIDSTKQKFHIDGFICSILCVPESEIL